MTWHRSNSTGDYLALAAKDQSQVDRSLGRISSYVSSSIQNALPIFSSIPESIQSKLKSANSLSQVESKLDAWEAPEKIEIAIYQTNLQSQIGGILFDAVTAKESDGLDFAQRSPYFDLSFDAAIDFFRSKNIVSAEEYALMEASAQRTAFSAKLLIDESIRQAAYTKISVALENGDNIRDFISTFGGLDLGVSANNAAYLENVFRTNIMSAYSEGKQAVAFSERGKERAPYILFKPIVDGRTRDSHAALFDLAMSKDNPNLVLPPFGYNCRCSFVSIANENDEYIVIDEMPTDLEVFSLDASIYC